MIGAEAHPETIVVVVTDTGVGIPDRHRDKIFEEFFQVDQTLARRQGGTGLGLAIAQPAGAPHGRRDHRRAAWSAAARGSRSPCRAPRARTRAARACRSGGSQPRARRSSGAASRRAGCARQSAVRLGFAGGLAGAAPEALLPATVLVVEDNEDNLFTLRQMLARRRARDRDRDDRAPGDRALPAAQLPDLVIMDVQMPGMSGLQATGAIRALPGGADVPIVALTAQAMKGDRERILAAGCDDYLAKPVQPNELMLGSSTRSCAAPARMRRFPRARRLPPGRLPTSRQLNHQMARILLVDDATGLRAGGSRGPGRPGRGRHETDTVGSAAEALTQDRRSAATTSSCCIPQSLAASLSSSPAGAPGAGRDVLRETFDVFEDGVCLVAPDGALEVANAIGARLYGSGLRGSCRPRRARRSPRAPTADRSLSDGGRAFAVRAYPLSGRGAVLYVRDATDEREREIGRLQAEKLASIGLLAAGVAHEINNPAAFVLANIEALTGHLRLIEDKLRDSRRRGGARAGLSDLLFEANAILQESKEGMARIHRIVRDLGSFSHADDDAIVADERQRWRSSRR